MIILIFQNCIILCITLIFSTIFLKSFSNNSISSGYSLMGHFWPSGLNLMTNCRNLWKNLRTSWTSFRYFYSKLKCIYLPFFIVTLVLYISNIKCQCGWLYFDWKIISNANKRSGRVLTFDLQFQPSTFNHETEIL